MTFSIEVEREEDGRWIAEVVDLPGVLVYGQTATRRRNHDPQDTVTGTVAITDPENGRTYYPLHGNELRVPGGAEDRPDAGLLRWHNEEVYVG